MNISTLITQLPTWLLFMLIVAFSFCAAMLGNYLAQYRKAHGKTKEDAPVGTAIGSILSLLAFMLAFIFSMTASRFGDRKNLVIQQANAIGTCFLRSSFLPEKQKLATRKLLREYVFILKNGQTVGTLDASLKRLDELNLLLWEQAATLDRENLDSEIRSLYISSLNEVIDISETRKTVALVFRIPGTLWSTLLILAALGMASIGYQTGFYSNSHKLDFILVGAAFALIFVLIADMDSVGIHRFKVSQKPVQDLYDLVNSNVP